MMGKKMFSFGGLLKFSYILFFICCHLINLIFAGSCRESNLCCPGKDSTCVVQKISLNAIVRRHTEKPCYCDHACLKLGDCCSDFKDACSGELLL